MSTTVSFEFDVTDKTEMGSRLVVGTAFPGMVGLSAVDYLVAHSESAQVGQVTARGLTDVTPFTDGVPRYPMRLYDVPEFDMTVLTSELFLPVGVGEPFSDALVAFANERGIEEITVVYGVPFPHGPEEHAVFYVATEEYRAGHLAETDIPPLGGGFFDGFLGELMLRGLGAESPPVGALVTPAHPPGPDLDAAIRVLEAVEELYGVAIDEAELRQRAEELRRQYQELADRMQTLEDGDLSASGRDYPEDRMFM
ncbi:proteasome assembly chaperone family protein [Halogeometricum luteum]|uniref:PAC2 family protein n=1 Tax=Halogeometricum luteum TaxID=2950537 RepID=A0ABU2G3P0_9EURY|nr:PAC2 family protein [Halogeometricum sp. S3BR5-2]MDS0295412.1 PAC2 family protein [Halogeometricum sp. S3BR5-2]